MSMHFLSVAAYLQPAMILQATVLSVLFCFINTHTIQVSISRLLTIRHITHFGNDCNSSGKIMYNYNCS